MTTEYNPRHDLLKLSGALGDCHKWVKSAHGGDLAEAIRIAPTFNDRKRVALSRYIWCVNSSRAVTGLVSSALHEPEHAFVVTLTIRSMIEWHVRSHWLDSIATDNEANKFLGGREDPPGLSSLLEKLIRVTEKRDQKDAHLLEHLSRRIGELNNFLHGGPDVLAGGIRDGRTMREISDYQMPLDMHALGCVMFLACEKVLRIIEVDQPQIDILRGQREEFQNQFDFR